LQLSLRRTPHRLPPPQGRRRIELERALTRYLQLQNAELERAAAAEVENRRRAAVRSEVGQLVTWLLLLTGYSLVLGVASRGLVLSALLNPQSIADNAVAARAYTDLAIGWVPEAFRGLVISALGAGALLVFRTTSFSVRSDLGGALFVGVATLSLLGLSAAAYSGPVGLMMAVPGFVAAALIVNELLRSLRRLRTGGVNPGPRRSPRYAALSDRWRRLADPTSRLWLSAVFLSLPWVCLAVVAASLVTHGGPLFPPSRTAMLAYVGWCCWACFATPGTVWIPLWSAVPWSVLLFLQLADDPVGEVFVLAVIALLFVSVVLVLWAPDRGAA
jgi:hypothetical protein